MRRNQLALYGILGILISVLASCGPKGGTVTLVNQTTYTLNNAKVSLGNSKVDTLYPGQSIKASVEKNINGANIGFGVPSHSLNTQVNTDKFEVISTVGGQFFAARWNSSLFPVKDGEAIIFTVREKK